jgi:intron-binding protein aquarius
MVSQIFSLLTAFIDCQLTYPSCPTLLYCADLFDKVVARGDVDERYMLRLGSGERNLTTTSSSSHDFTKTGRVAHILSRRSFLLEKVQLLSESLGLSGRSERGADGAPSYSCESKLQYVFCT